jgi:uncharacterized damage-inducible protein DinB
MQNIHAIAGQVEWAAKNIAYNLDFIPEDKLGFKPSPSANSALEIVAHTAQALDFFKAAVQGQPPRQPSAADSNVPDTGEQAKQMIVDSATGYAEALRALTPEDLSRKVELPFGTLPLPFMASMAATDLIHHHGQIAYIQTILGDTESHFDMSLLPKGE